MPNSSREKNTRVTRKHDVFFQPRGLTALARLSRTPKLALTRWVVACVP